MSLTSPCGSKIPVLEVNQAAGFQMGMSNWCTDLTSLDRVFVFCAFVGILLFIVRLVLQIFGGTMEQTPATAAMSEMASVELPEYLGKLKDDSGSVSGKSSGDRDTTA